MSNNEKEVEKYKKLADTGDVRAMYKYAKMLYKGDGIPINKEEAIKYLKMAAAKGNTIAMLDCAKIFYESNDKITAYAYYKSAAISEENIYAMFKCAKMLYNGDGIDKNKEEAAKYYKMAADKGNNIAMFEYAKMLYKGDGIPINKEETIKYLKMAADKGNTQAMFDYAIMLYKGNVVDKDKTAAYVYYQMAAINGNAQAMFKCAEMLYKGDGIDENKEEAVKYFEMAAINGNTQAMFKYAEMLYKGDGIGENKQKAYAYYQIAAINGNAQAMFKYAEMLYKGDGIDENKEESAKYYQMAANNGNNEAKKKLEEFDKNIRARAEFEARYEEAENLYDSVEVNFDEKEELIDFFKAEMDKGNTDAKFMYAMMLESDNINEAFKYYKEVLDEVKNNNDKEYLFNTKALENKIKDIENDIINAKEIESLEINDLKKIAEEQGYKIGKKLGKGAYGVAYTASKISKDGLSEESYVIKFPTVYNGNVKTLKELEEVKEVQTLIDLAGGGHTKKIDGFNARLKGEEKVCQVEVFKIREKGELKKPLEDIKNSLAPEGLGNGYPGIAYLIQSAISYNNLHKLGITHNDIKLENTLIGETPEEFYGDVDYKDYLRIKTADYGISTNKRINNEAGTPVNMAPEIFKGEKFIDDKVDVYSMVIMFTKIIGTRSVDFEDTDLFDLNEEEKKSLKSEYANFALRNFKINKEINEKKLEEILGDVCYSLFPNNNFDTETVNYIEKKTLELLLGMFKKDPKDRLSSSQVTEKLGEIVLGTGLSPVDLEEKYGIFEKDLYGLGIFTETNLSERENKIKKDLELLKKGGKSEDPKEQTHLNTLTGKKELSKKCENCLESLLNCFGKEKGEINLNLKDNEEFKKNLERVRKSGNQREYLLVVNKMLEIKELKMNYEIFRLEEIKKGVKEEKEIESKKEELRKFKEEKRLIIQKHAELSRVSNVIREKEENKKAKKEMEKLLEVTGEFSLLEKGTGIRER